MNLTSPRGNGLGEKMLYLSQRKWLAKENHSTESKVLTYQTGLKKDNDSKLRFANPTTLMEKSEKQKHEVLEEETILVRCKWYSPREMADS
ncbi:hypothetical protein YC2023_042317 [Brassica napus]